MKIKAALKTHINFTILAITPGATGLVAWRWVAESMFSSKYTGSGISLPQPMGSGTDPGSSAGFGASMPADDGPGGEARSVAEYRFSYIPGSTVEQPIIYRP